MELYTYKCMLYAKCSSGQSMDCPVQTSDLKFALDIQYTEIKSGVTSLENHAPWIAQSSDCGCTKYGRTGKSRAYSNQPTLQTSIEMLLLEHLTLHHSSFSKRAHNQFVLCA